MDMHVMIMIDACAQLNKDVADDFSDAARLTCWHIPLQ
jgi:hypothetical protein